MERYQYVVLLLALSIGSYVPAGQHNVPDLKTVAATPHGYHYVLGETNSTKVCTSLGGSWSNSSYTCTSSNLTLSSYDTLVVERGASLLITRTVTLLSDFDNYGTINNYGTIIAGGIITNYGFISNDGTINVRGGSRVGGGCSGGGGLNNARWIYNRGTINNYQCGGFVNYYDVPDQAYGQTINFGVGTINNYGDMFLDNGNGIYNETFSTGINNYGVINNLDPGTFFLYDYTFLNNYNGTINIGKNSFLLNDHGILRNWLGTINNQGIFNNGRTVHNYATLNNYGTLTNLKGDFAFITDWYYGALENEKGATLNNDGTIKNAWDIGNYGTFNNRGMVENNGTIFRDFNGTFTNINGGAINNHNGTVEDCFVLLLILTIRHKGDYLSNACAATDFSLTASPASLTVHQGSSDTSTIAVGPDTTFSRNITLSMPIVAPGITLSLTYHNITSFRSSILTITVASSVPAGSYDLHFDGTIRSLTHSVDITLVVMPPAGLSLTARSSLNMETDATSAIPIKVSPLYGFVGRVNFTLTAPPELSCFQADRLQQPGTLASVDLASTPVTVNLACTSSTTGDFSVNVVATGIPLTCARDASGSCVRNVCVRDLSGSCMRVREESSIAVHVTPSTSPFRTPGSDGSVFQFDPRILYWGAGILLAWVVIAVVVILIVVRRNRPKSIP